MSPPRLILHGGTPKTSTTSVQWFLDAHREELVERGVLYPELEPGVGSRKHQWLVEALLGDRPGGVLPKLAETVRSVPQGVHTVILSTEGIFNRWWEFTAAGRAELATLAAQCEVELWVWFRNPVSFARAKYVQVLRNSPGAIPLYGGDLTLEEVLEDPWFNRGLDYIGFIEDADALLGAGTVKPFAYDGHVLEEMLARLGVADLDPATIRRNPTPSARAVRVIRAINRSGVAGRRRDVFMGLIERLDGMIPLPRRPLPISTSARLRIAELSAASVTALRDIYGLSLSSEHPTLPPPSPLSLST